MTTHPTSAGAATRRKGFLVLGLLVLLFAFVRLRGRVPAVRAVHRWLASVGVPEDLRALDATLLLVGGAFLAAWFLARRQVAAALGLRRPIGPSARIAAIGALPMLVAAWAVGEGWSPSWALVPGALVAPFVEELFFRGALVALPVRAAGLPFWPVAIVSAALFGASHAPWSDALSWGHVPVILVTGAGGLWFAWLLRTAPWNLWLPIFVHAGMNLAWMLFRASPDAVGGWQANVGRAGTIALVTWLVLRERSAARSGTASGTRRPSSP
ncbi:MAG TPA: CPBP family intramembrane glutamic endopeptidase [Planctomycetota bacterium]|nr:CPBP family intramembrane glutamic endopeptidase [Planctomycetota bacterium]